MTTGLQPASGSGEVPAAPPKNTRKPLGARLIEAGLLSEDQLDLALREQKRQGRLLGEVLVELGFVAPEIITGLIAGESKTQLVDVVNAVVDGDVLDLTRLRNRQTF